MQSVVTWIKKAPAHLSSFSFRETAREVAQSGFSLAALIAFFVIQIFWGQWKLVSLSRDVCLWAADDSRPQRESDVVFVTMGDDDLKKYHARDPLYLDRKVWGRAVEKLTKYGADVILFDVHFVHPTPEDEESDKVFGRSIAESKRVVLAKVWEKDANSGGNKLRDPIEVLTRGALGLGFVNWTPDPDGILRRFKVVMQERGVTHRHIGLESIVKGRNGGKVQFDDDGIRVTGRKNGKDLLIPTNFEGKSIVNYSSVPEIPRISLSDLLDPANEGLSQLHQALVKDKIIILGSVSPLLKDRHPYQRNWMTGAITHEDGPWFIAVLIQNILDGAFLAPVFEGSFLVPFLVFLLFATILTHVTPAQGAGVVIGGIGIFWITSFACYSREMLFDSTSPTLALIILYIGQNIARMVVDRKRFAKLNRELSQEMTQMRERLSQIGTASEIQAKKDDPPEYADSAFVTRFLPDHFDKVEFLGQGGMGVVYKAIDKNRGHPVALKVLSPLVQDNKTAVARFLAEAKVMKKLSHPGLVEVYEVGKHVLSFFTMELVDGEPLDTHLDNNPGIKLRARLDILLQTAEVLGYIHGKGIIHRDLKPSNLMALKDGEIKLLDFGLAHDEDVTSVTKTGDVMGTLRYMAPEQFAGRATSPATDIYSLGIVACYVLAGKTPERKDKIHEPAGPLLTEAKLPKPIIEFIESMLEEIPNLRPADGSAVATELSKLMKTI